MTRLAWSRKRPTVIHSEQHPSPEALELGHPISSPLDHLDPFRGSLGVTVGEPGVQEAQDLGPCVQGGEEFEEVKQSRLLDV